MSVPSHPHSEHEEIEDRILSKAVKAGCRTYFFDVRQTRNEDYYLTITESRKFTAPDGSVSYNRHKIFLYKEDFDKFADGLQGVVTFIRSKMAAEEEQGAVDAVK